MAGEGSATQGDRVDRNTWFALSAMALGVFVIANDFTALSVAIPEIEHDLSTTLTKAQWVINGYALVFGVLLVTGGRLADLFGRKRVFMVGATIFAGFSLLAGLVPGAGLLIAARMAMGIGGALMWPAILGMTYALLPDSKAGLAGGIILGVAGLGNAVGPMLGGFLTDEFSWRWVFFVNLPITAFAMFVTWRRVPESREPDAQRHIDYGGIALVSTAIVLVLVGLDEGSTEGFGSAPIVACFVIGAALLFAFFRFERRQGDGALVPTDVLRNRVFAAACLATLLMSAIFFSALLYVPQFFENVLDDSALRAGAGLLPLMGVFAATSFVAGSLYNRVGGRVVVAAGAAFLGVGILLLSFIDSDSGYGAFVPGMIVLGVGVGLFYSSVTTIAVTSLDPSRSSLAGGIVYMCQIAGGAVGLGLNTALVTSESSLADGIALAFKVDAALAFVGLVVVLACIGRPAPVEGHPRALRWRHRAHA
jgi:EmrB/QacA subfamily drug resistance transporter